MDEDFDLVMRSKEASQIIAYIERLSNTMINYRREVDAIFLGDRNPAESTADLRRDAPKWYKAFKDLQVFCADMQDKFKMLQVRLVNEFDEADWVQSFQNILNTPTHIIAALNGYKQGATYKTVYSLVQNRNVITIPEDNQPQSRNEYIDLNANQQFNATGDRNFRADKPQKKNVFQQIAEADDVTMNLVADMVSQTYSNPNPASMGQGAHQTHTNDDAYNTLNNDGRLGSGALHGRASDTDIRQVDNNQKDIDMNEAAAHQPTPSGFVNATVKPSPAPSRR